MKKMHFISGLPRSGSTLLSAILKQNPKFTAGISDPLLDFTKGYITAIAGSVGMASQVPREKQKDLILDCFHSFYKNNNDICFNTNRGWASHTPLVKQLFPQAKMILCIREIPWILDSFEQLNVKNPFTIKPLYNHQDLGTVYDRSKMLMGDMPNFGGYVMSPLANTKQAMYSNEKDMLCIIEYNTLVNHPKEVMQSLYKFLDEEWFEHDFDNVEDSYDEFDDQAKIVGLHTVKRKVQYYPRKPILPEDLWQHYANQSFWKNNFEHMKRQLYWIGQ